MSGKYLRGAFVEFMPTFLVPLPNVIIFQFNPETMTHTWTPPQGVAAGTGTRSNPLAVRGVPGETFSVSLAMDAADLVADGSPVAAGIAQLSGIYTRLAALEMLQYPVAAAGGGLLGSVSASISVGAGGVSIGGAAGGAVPRSVPESQVPTVLFVWGIGRILPVRVTSLTITEKLYDPLLNPTHADATVGLKVLTPDELAFVTGPLKGIARGAYKYSQGLRQALALANLANSAESVIGMLPI
jgi:hypothetical protein